MTALGVFKADAPDDAMCVPSGIECISIVARHHGVHLLAAQTALDNHLTGVELSAEEIARCAARAGLKAKHVQLTWRSLSHLKKALPVIVRLTSGASMVLEGLDANPDAPAVILRDPKAGDDAKLVVDRIRFEQAWTRDVVLLRRNYDLADEEQPFSLGLIAALILRERRSVRDLTICAMALSLFALAPIVFWRLLSDKVIYYGSLNTFTVLCIAMGVIIVFETIFAYLRSFLVLFMTARVDVRLSEYLLDHVLKLPIDYFERTQVGIIGRDMNEIWRVRTFLTGQLFGTVLEFADPLRFPAGDVLLQPVAYADRPRDLRPDCRLAGHDASPLPQADRRRLAGGGGARSVPFSDPSGNSNREVAVPRRPPAAAMGRSRRSNCEVEARGGIDLGDYPGWSSPA